MYPEAVSVNLHGALIVGRSFMMSSSSATTMGYLEYPYE